MLPSGFLTYRHPLRAAPPPHHPCRYYDMQAWERQQMIKKHAKMMKAGNRGAALTDEEQRRCGREREGGGLVALARWCLVWVG